MKFNVKLFDWVLGILNVQEFNFENLEQAKTHATASKSRNAKIYNLKGEMIDHIQHIPVNNNTYA
jgi:hypothetical protein